MKFISISIFIFLISIQLISWQTDSVRKSQIIYFRYVGTGDTTASLIGGDIWEKCKLQSCKLKKHPISNVLIKDCDGVILGKTNWEGKFEIATIGNPKFCFKIEKDGYETVMIKDVYSISGKFYDLQLNLEKGSLLTEYSYVRDY